MFASLTPVAFRWRHSYHTVINHRPLRNLELSKQILPPLRPSWISEKDGAMLELPGSLSRTQVANPEWQLIPRVLILSLTLTTICSKVLTFQPSPTQPRTYET
jgi:hypothetical protein